MKIVLKQDVAELGSAGDVKNVATGYARNYLIPQGLAVKATATALKQTEQLRSAGTRRDERLAAQAVELAERISATTLTFEAKAGEKGRLYGSITTGDIAEALSKEIGESLDRRKHILGDPIRHVGEHVVPVRLSAEVTAELKVLVNPVGGEAAQEPDMTAEEAPSGEATEPDASAPVEPEATEEEASSDDSGEPAESEGEEPQQD
ncbi:MAG: 50S ribosomal protein L9 [Anaerolineales bacterium]|nr:MAG: 50S ribosomal protein L9 [Anaerolineales bacterium]